MSSSPEVQIQELRYKLQVQFPRVTSLNLWVTSSNPQVTNSNLPITSLNPGVTNLSPKLTSLNPRVQESFNQ